MAGDTSRALGCRRLAGGKIEFDAVIGRDGSERTDPAENLKVSEIGRAAEDRFEAANVGVRRPGKGSRKAELEEERRFGAHAVDHGPKDRPLTEGVAALNGSAGLLKNKKVGKSGEDFPGVKVEEEPARTRGTRTLAAVAARRGATG